MYLIQRQTGQEVESTNQWKKRINKFLGLDYMEVKQFLEEARAEG